MSRVARKDILYDGCFAHVISRSIREYKIFKDRDDFETFQILLAKVKQEYTFKIMHYCFMNTHFHLAVKIPEVDSFSKGIQKLKSLYSYQFHAKYKISGPIWRERFRSLLIENEEYLYACGMYIEYNPVKAGIVKESHNWEYSSSQYYRGKPDMLVDGYKTIKTPKIPEDINTQDERIFEKGQTIGSSFFRFQLREMFKRGVPV